MKALNEMHGIRGFLTLTILDIEGHQAYALLPPKL